MQLSSDNDLENTTQKSKRPGSNKGTLIIVLLVSTLVLVSAAGGFLAGNAYGQAKGKQAAVSQVTDLLNPLNAISNNAAFPYTVIGKVTDASAKSITVKMPNGKEKSVTLSERTKVSQGSSVKSVNDIKDNSNVTVFTVGKGSDEVASRIVIR